MKYKVPKLIISYFLFLITILVFSDKLNINHDWRYKVKLLDNKIINPLCFFHHARHDNFFEPKDFTECQKYKNVDLESDKDFISATRPRKNEDDYYRGYAAYYKPLQLQNGSNIISFVENGGGTGHFTSIWKLEEKLNWSTKTGKLEKLIQTKFVGGRGDRCNGGVSDVRLGYDDKGEFIQIKSQITAFMFLEENKPSQSFAYLPSLVKKDMSKVKRKYNLSVLPYKEVANCALCCSGEKIIKKYKNKKEIFYKLHNKHRSFYNEYELPTQGKYQECFNEIVTNKIDEMGLNKYILLNDDQANSLRQDFYNKCIKPVEDKKKEMEELEKLVLSYDTPKLCEAALDAQNKKEWDYSSFYSKFAVKTALNKGLTCGINLFKGMFNHEQICDKATTADLSWTQDKDLIEFVSEAKRLNLECENILKSSLN